MWADVCGRSVSEGLYKLLKEGATLSSTRNVASSGTSLCIDVINMTMGPLLGLGYYA